MSAIGEFNRLAEDCLSYLEASSAAADDSWRSALGPASGKSPDSLDVAAERALALLDEHRAKSGLRFVEAREHEEFAELADHLAAICRAVLGRPAPEPHRPGAGGSS